MQAIAGEGAHLTGGRKAVFLHFDAHTDAYEQIPHFLGAVKSAAHWAGYLVRDGYIDAGHSVQIGMRGNPRTLDWRKPSEELGYEVITMDRYREMGPDDTMALIDERIGDAPLYVTFDLDCLDPTVAPAVANLEGRLRGFRDRRGHASPALRARQGRDRRRRGLPHADQGSPQPDHGAYRGGDHVRDRQPWSRTAFGDSGRARYRPGRWRAVERL